MTLLLAKLAIAGLRHRLLPGILTMALTASAAAAIVMAFEIRTAASDPWARTFEAANGADVLANVATMSDAAMVATLPGVADRDLPMPIAHVRLGIGESSVDVLVVGLRSNPRINVPISTSSWILKPGTIVFERSLAETLNIPVGSAVSAQTAGGIRVLTVTGTAIVPSQPRYPRSNPGLAWVPYDALPTIAPDRGTWRWLQPVKLNDPFSAPSYVAAAERLLPPDSASFESWQAQRDELLVEGQPVQFLLSAFALLLLGVSIAVVVILAGARVAGQEREFGLLGAVGLTPVQFRLVFLFEQLALSLFGTVLGFAAGTIATPVLAASSMVTLLGSAPVDFELKALWYAAAAVSLVVGSASWLAMGRSRRFTASRRLLGGGQPQTGVLSRSVGMLPLPLFVGAIDLLARCRRGFWLASTFLVTASALIVSVLVRATLMVEPASGVSDVPEELPRLIVVLDSVLVVINGSLLIAMVILTVRERLRDFAILRTVGFTPGQISIGVSGAYSLVACAASLVAVPIGIALFALLRNAVGETAGARVDTPWPWIGAVCAAVTGISLVATALVARVANRMSIADAVRRE